MSIDQTIHLNQTPNEITELDEFPQVITSPEQLDTKNKAKSTPAFQSKKPQLKLGSIGR